VSDYYLILGVAREASEGAIRRAFRRLARRYHPDLNPGDQQAADRFRAISEAFETLTDPERRRRYDRDGVTGPPVRVEAVYEFAGFDFSGRAAQAPPSFVELFAGPGQAGGPAAPGPPEPGADIFATLDIEFEDAWRGGERQVVVDRLERCAPCAGHGAFRGPEVPCPRCEGHGQVRTARGHMVFTRACAGCGGTGVVAYRICASCGGEGVGVRAEVVTLAVPPGVADGAQISLPGQGHAGRRGGPAGALRVQVAVRPHPRFERRGYDVHLEVPVAIHEAGLGARIEVAGPDGPVRLRIPPGTPSGQRFRLRGRGVPMGTPEARGDLLVTVRLVWPPVLDERARALLTEFARLHPEDVRAGMGI
jgi:molecular chaperone DnaJ